MRYSRFLRIERITDALQESLEDARIAVVGAGALGSHILDTLARQIVPDLTIIDRDILSAANLSTSALYTPEQVERGKAKAQAAREALRAINPDVDITAHAADFNANTISPLLEDVDFVLDATDNMQTRHLLNEYSCKTETPWIFSTCLGSQGFVLPLDLGDACFRCVFEEIPPGTLETCETTGLLKETAAFTASLATTTALRLLAGEVEQELFAFDLWTGRFDTLNVERTADCPVCVQETYAHLNRPPRTTALCGDHTFQIRGNGSVDIDRLAKRLEDRGDVTRSEHVLTFKAEGKRLALFPDGRAIVENVRDEKAAKALYDRFIGS